MRPAVVAQLEAIGVRRLVDLRGEDPFGLMKRVNFAAGHPVWHPPMATRALANLIAAADDEGKGA